MIALTDLTEERTFFWMNYAIFALCAAAAAAIVPNSQKTQHCLFSTQSQHRWNHNTASWRVYNGANPIHHTLTFLWDFIKTLAHIPMKYNRNIVIKIKFPDTFYDLEHVQNSWCNIQTTQEGMKKKQSVRDYFFLYSREKCI